MILEIAHLGAQIKPPPSASYPGDKASRLGCVAAKPHGSSVKSPRVGAPNGVRTDASDADADRPCRAGTCPVRRARACRPTGAGWGGGGPRHRHARATGDARRVYRARLCQCRRRKAAAWCRACSALSTANPFIVKGLAAQAIRGYVFESLMARGYNEPFTSTACWRARSRPTRRAATSFSPSIRRRAFPTASR